MLNGNFSAGLGYLLTSCCEVRSLQFHKLGKLLSFLLVACSNHEVNIQHALVVGHGTIKLHDCYVGHWETGVTLTKIPAWQQTLHVTVLEHHESLFDSAVHDMTITDHSFQLALRVFVSDILSQDKQNYRWEVIGFSRVNDCYCY